MKSFGPLSRVSELSQKCPTGNTCEYGYYKLFSKYIIWKMGAKDVFDGAAKCCCCCRHSLNRFQAVLGEEAEAAFLSGPIALLWASHYLLNQMDQIQSIGQVIVAFCHRTGPSYRK